ncbi:Uncharacterised protein [Streptococcus pneumoniae]|nr:Uncharacterised protein [Streptococcus pneumoniae]
MVDINGDTLVKYVHFSIPKLTLNFWVFTVSCDSSVQLADIFVAFTDHPA